VSIGSKLVHYPLCTAVVAKLALGVFVAVFLCSGETQPIRLELCCSECLELIFCFEPSAIAGDAIWSDFDSPRFLEIVDEKRE
jgi:hypothetical protein